MAKKTKNLSLIDYLREQDYDLIDGPLRRHDILQLWELQSRNHIEFYYEHVLHAFKSDKDLATAIVSSDALTVDETRKTDYNFNIGITILEKLLSTLSLGTLNLSSKLQKGKKVSIGYANSETKELPTGKIQEFFLSTGFDFTHSNPKLLETANNDDIVLISGIVYAQNLVAEIETTSDITAELEAELKELVATNIDFKRTAENKLKMTAQGGKRTPIAVRAHRLIFDKSKFKKLELITNKKSRF